MKIIFFIFFLSLNFSYGQEKFINSHDGIYIEEGLIYKVKDHELFTGTIEFTRKNGAIVSKEVYEGGYKTNEYEYYNKSASGKVYKEIVYYREKIHLEDERFKIHKVILYHTNGQIYSVKHYDLQNDKTLEEEFENSKLIYSCEFKNGKKNGKEFCTSKKSGSTTIIYSNGKKK